MKSILIIIPYFGKLPDTFKFWYSSAVTNPDVDFLFITDQEVKEASNIHIMKSTFDETRQRISKSVGMDVNLTKPHKLCDFKPVYGHIYSEEVKDYDFWGFGDIDLVYGRIRDFITDEVLSRYDMISGWGHLTLYRNCEFCNNFYQRKLEGHLYYKDCFAETDATCFDEYPRNGLSSVWDVLYPERVYHCETSFDDVAIQAHCKHFRSVFSPDRHCLTFIYEDKNLYRIYYDSRYHRHKEPTLYAHFQKRYNWKIETDDCSRYIIYPNIFRKPFHFFLYIKLMWLGSSKIVKLSQKK